MRTAGTPWRARGTAIRTWCRPSRSRRAGCSSTRRCCRIRCASRWPSGWWGTCRREWSHAFFCNSGAEANENAMHLARKRTGRQRMVSVAGGWHGRSVACCAVTDGAKYEIGATRAGMPLSHEGAVRRRRGARACHGRVGGGPHRGAGAGHVGRAPLLARVPAGGARGVHPGGRRAHLRRDPVRRGPRWAPSRRRSSTA